MRRKIILELFICRYKKLRKINHFDAAKNNFRTFNFAVTKIYKIINQLVVAKNNFRIFILQLQNLRKINHFVAAKNNFRTFHFAVSKLTKNQSACCGKK